MKRILYTINNLNTAGMKYVLADLAKGVNKQDFEPLIAINKKYNSGLEKDLERHFPVIELNLRIPRRPYISFPLRLWKTSQKLRKLNIDLAHSFDYASDWTEGLAMKLAGVKYVAEKTNLFYSKKWDRKLRLADSIVCLSNAQAIQLAKFSNKVTRIPTGIELSRFGTNNALDRSDLGWKKDDVILTCLAHLVEVKAHPILFKALDQIKESIKDNPAIKEDNFGRYVPIK